MGNTTVTREYMASESREKAKKLQEACMPAVEFLRKEVHPLHKIIITSDSITLVEDEIGIPLPIMED